jgi:tetratricopeptide (TPR) repeat protein
MRPSDRPRVANANTAIGCLAFSPDGSLLAAGFGQQSWISSSEKPVPLKVWEVASGREVLALDVEDYVRSLAFSPDGKRLVAACRHDGIGVREVGTWRETIWPAGTPGPSQPAGSTNRVWSVAFSPDGAMLAVGYANGSIALCDAATGSIVRGFGGHAGRVIQLAFSGDGRTLASASGDKTAKLWDVKSGRELRTLRAHTVDLSSIAFAPDGDVLATGSEDRTVRLWEAESPLEIALDKGDLGTVDELHSQDLAAHPDDLRPWTRRALALLRHGQADEALADLLSALKLVLESDPDHQPDPTAVADELAAWTVLFPPAIFDRVKEAASQDSEAVLQVAISQAPEDPQVWRERSRVFTLLGQQARAEADLARAIKLTPGGSDDRLTWIELAQFYTEYHQPGMARAALAKSELLACRNPQMLRQWGLQFTEKGAWAKAAAVFGQASALDPDDVFTARCWAQLLWQAGDVAGYRRVADALLDRFGSTKSPIDVLSLIVALVHGPYHTGDWEPMIRLGQESVAREPTLPWFHHGLAGLHLRAGQYQRALRCLDESDRLSGPSQETWNARVLNDLLRAIVHVRLGDADKARQLLVQADQWFEQHLKPEPRQPFGEWTDIIWIDWVSFQYLRHEAAMLLLDAGFPADPFAR